MSEVIKETDGFRVKLIRDEYPHEPEDCGHGPLLRIDRTGRYGATAEHIMVGDRPTDDDARIEQAAAAWAHSGDHTKLEKYLRAFHGATVIKWYGPNNYTDYTYVAYDTPAWIKSIGFDDVIAPRANFNAAEAVNMDEYRAYIEGEVYGCVVERKVHVKSRKDIHVNGEPLRTEESEYNEWEEVDSLWGFYGYEYAQEAAEEALEEAYADRNSKQEEWHVV